MKPVTISYTNMYVFRQHRDRAIIYLRENILGNIDMLSFERGPGGRGSLMTPDGAPSDPMTDGKLNDSFHVRDFYGLDLLSLSRARNHGERMVWCRSGLTGHEFLERLKKRVIFADAIAVSVTDGFQTNRDRVPVPKGVR